MGAATQLEKLVMLIVRGERMGCALVGEVGVVVEIKPRTARRADSL
jgi:hypothetical protein